MKHHVVTVEIGQDLNAMAYRRLRCCCSWCLESSDKKATRSQRTSRSYDTMSRFLGHLEDREGTQLALVHQSTSPWVEPSHRPGDGYGHCARPHLRT